MWTVFSEVQSPCRPTSRTHSHPKLSLTLVQVWIKSISRPKILQRQWKGQVESWKLKHRQKVSFTLVDHPIIHSETLCLVMVLSHLSKSANHTVLHLRQRAWKEAHGGLLLSASFQKGRRYEGKTGSGCFSCLCVAHSCLGCRQHGPNIHMRIGAWLWSFHSEKHRDQARPESRLPHLKVAFATKSAIRQQVPVFTEKILAYSSSVSLFYCHMRRMHSTHGLLRDLNC